MKKLNSHRFFFLHLNKRIGNTRFNFSKINLIIDEDFFEKSPERDALGIILGESYSKYQEWCIDNQSRLNERFAYDHTEYVHTIHYHPQSHHFLVVGNFIGENFYRIRFTAGSNKNYMVNKPQPLIQLHRTFTKAQVFVHIHLNDIEILLENFRPTRRTTFVLHTSNPIKQ